MIQILHNNRCGKSRECLAFLDASGCEYEIVDYLKRPLKFRELKALLKKLKLRPIEIVRTNEADWQPFRKLELSHDDIVRILVKNPVLIQRPIVINGNKAVVARPAEAASEVF
ncbi:ArsC/Spx/MgsR family protein [Flavobacterium selenitireducens]|uniref:ArsC/Spx/MgsR family protein n=1 Tax=Flavobacterium selenitireducens TaxID=2722704 RepID=UPI00168B75E4|nr:ArsC/Spx/MgsR family protein [Flavobacterium selenitireducens]MBD3580901.1 arsenate reductase [Flavobacterium selenitireducens]